MKRSEINRIVVEAARFFAERRFALPPFAHWSIDEWREQAERARGIVGSAGT
jgi:D-lyxose ketol-isomerase